MKVFIVFFSLFMYVLLITNSYKSKTEYIEVTNKEDVDIVEQINFEDSVYNYIIEINIKHPDIVFKQARIESGNFQSKVFLENNNMFGMKVPYKRPNLVIGSNRGYAKYRNWKEGVIDYALYQVYTAKGLSEEDYIKHLDTNYAEDPNYAKKLK